MLGNCRGSPGCIRPGICIPATIGFVFIFIRICSFHYRQEENSFEKASFQARTHAKSSHPRTHF
jgi:hypothetical protein